MSTCRQQQLCCTCVCDLGALSRIRDLDGGVRVVVGIAAVVGSRARRCVSVLRFVDCGIVVTSWGGLDAEDGPISQFWPIQTAVEHCLHATNGHLEERRCLRRRDLHCGRQRASCASCTRNRCLNPVIGVSRTLQLADIDRDRAVAINSAGRSPKIVFLVRQGFQAV